MADNQISKAIEKIVAEAGAELIECRILRSGSGRRVRCLVDYPGGGITVSDCAAINKRLVSFLDKQDGVYADTIVEINSPGLDRLLRTSADFLRVQGKAILLWLSRPINDRLYLEGVVSDVSGAGLRISFKGKTVLVPFDAIKVGKEKIEI